VRSLQLVALGLVALTAGAEPIAARGQAKQYPIFTADHFVAAMKTIGQAFELVNTSLGRKEYEESKAYLAISRDRLATTITFWRDRKKDDAVKMLRETLTRLDALDAAMSSESVDPAAVAAAAKQAGSSCEACHAVYREQDPATKAYRFKGGLTE
jgi:hypothetical protein